MIFSIHLKHRDKTRVYACKNVSSFGFIMLAVYGPHSWFWHKAKKQFIDQIWCFYNKSKILTILCIVKYEKSHFWWVFSVIGAHNQQVFCMFKWGKKHKKQRVLALILSLWFEATKAERMNTMAWPNLVTLVTNKVKVKQEFSKLRVHQIHFSSWLRQPGGSR